MTQSHVRPASTYNGLQPPCPQCGSPMFMARIDAVSLGVDQRTFQCRNCKFIETTLVKRR